MQLDEQPMECSMCDLSEQIKEHSAKGETSFVCDWCLTRFDIDGDGAEGQDYGTKEYLKMQPSQEIQDYLNESIGVVEATSFEKFSLWKDHKENWDEVLSGFGITVGEIDNRPVAISIQADIIYGQRVIFYHPTSQVVDWGLIEEWLYQNMPDSAKDSGRLRKSDAQNFHNIINYAQGRVENNAA